MKGIFFNIVEDVVSEHLSDAMWDEILANAGIDRGYSALGNYPDQEMTALVDAAAGALGQSPRQVMRWIGERGLIHLVERSPHFFEPHSSARTLLPTLDGIIHPEVRKLYKDAQTPSFDCRNIDDCHMSVIYASHRAMCGLAEGLMQGVGNYYSDSLHIQHPECVHDGGDKCRFELHFS